MSNKKILKELKEFNKDLEEHLPKFNTEYLKNENLFKSNQQDELTPIVMSNILDLRTEIELMRKNLIDNVEGMVTRVISDNQNTMENYFQKIISNFFIDLKTNMYTYFNELSQEVSESKKEIIKLKEEIKKNNLKFVKIEEKIQYIDSSKTDLIQFKNNIKKEFQNISLESTDNINQINNTIEKLEDQQNQIYSQINNNMEKINKNISEQINDLNFNIKKQSKDINFLGLEIKNNPNKTIIQKTIEKQIPTIIEKEIKNPIKKKENKDISNKEEISKPQKIEYKKDKIKNIDSLINNNIKNKQETNKKLISVEQRLKKLESLK